MDASDPQDDLPAEADEAAWEEYLDAVLEGRDEDPAGFLARHPAASPGLAARLEALRRAKGGAPAPDSASAPRPEADPGLPWERLGEYRLLRRIGEGGMGVVFLAEQESLGRTVALKVVRPELVHSPEAAERFRREARAVARLRHPGIVTVHGVGEENGVRFLAMEMVPGESLEAILDGGGALPPARVARWGARLARALDYAHGEGIVHRDVKPGNVRITPDDEPLLLDFGVARSADASLPTLTSAFVGSPRYAAPEQIAGAATDARADVYGLGATLYHALTGSAPFPAESVDRLFHAILSEAPVPVRKRNAAVSRDLAVVVEHALEREPARRYGNAREFAEDLEALLDFRPIRARPPGPLRRLSAAGRRRPALAGTIVTALVALAGLAVFFALRARAARLERERDAVAAVQDARARLESYRAQRREAAASEREMARLHQALEGSYLPPGDDRLLERVEKDVEAFRRAREAVFHEVLDHLRRARRLDPGVGEVEEVRAELWMEKWREARDARDPAGMKFYEDLVAREGGEERFRDELRGGGTVAIASDPPGAEVHLFRFRELSEIVEGGEARLVPVPWRSGEPGLRLTDASRLGEAPLAPVALTRGECLLVLRAPGRAEQRILFTLRPGHTEEYEIHLPPADVAPPGFRRIPAPWDEPGGPFWIAENEVTAGEYLDFLNDPATLRAIDDAGERTLFPRDATSAAREGYWPRNEAGGYRLPDDWTAAWPVLGVSFLDARAYAAWRTARARAAGRKWRFGLPTRGQWEAAAGVGSRRFVYGNRFRPKWTKSCFARPQASPEPIRSYPRDESVYGLFDMGGGAMEWCEGWFDEGRGLRLLKGGSWARAKAEFFELWGGFGLGESDASGETGIRLVCEVAEEGR